MKSQNLQYRDFSEWQNTYLKSEDVAKQEEYWIERFLGEIPVLNMPLDYVRPTVQEFNGDGIKLELSRELSSKLNELAKDAGATLYMVLLSAINILLSKYTGQEDIIIGSPIAGRQHADIENMVGMFVNTLVMRNFPSGNLTYAEFLNSVKDNSLKAYENQDYQFEELINKLNLRRDMSRNPLFDVMFVLQNVETTDETDVSELEFDDLKFTQYTEVEKTVKFDLTFEAVEMEENIIISIEYCTSLFKKGTIDRLGAHMLNIIEAITTNTSVVLGEIDILSAEEREIILFEFNDTCADYPLEKTLHQLFEEQVIKAPGNTALIFGEESMRYSELNAKANQLAHRLRDNGVKPDTIVGLMVERSFEMIVGILGILKAGGAYLPIDPNYPKDRILFMLEDSKTKILLTQSWLGDGLSFEYERLNLDNRELYVGDTTDLDIVNTSNNLAYVIYTSGSTGMPKGVMVEHKAIVNRLIWMQEKYPLKKDDVILQKTTYTFDVSVWELLWWSLAGASVCILGPGEEKDLEAMIQSIMKNHVTVMHFVPSMLSVFLEYVKQKDSATQIKTLKRVFASGEALSSKQAFDFSQIINQANETELINLYGPTEAAVDVSYFDATAHPSNEIVPIGKPINNISLYIVGKNYELLPIGVPGELCIAGDGLARGYLNRPELTLEKFVTNPFIPGERMYRTGDLTRWLPDGNIEFLGRIDYQVKIRGFRIELGEIESRLLAFDGVKEAIVLAREDEPGDKYLCAYLVAEEETPSSEFKYYLSGYLPDYMIPSYFVYLEKMPLTPNGKLDRKAFKAPEGNVYAEYVAPRDATEEILANIWSEVLGREKVGVHDNFFEAGGHSLKAITLISKINSDMELNIPLAELYNHPSIADIAGYINAAKEDEREAVDGLILLKKGKRVGKNFFMIHSAYSEGYSYVKLANNMGDEFNYWGVNYEKPDSYDPCVLPMEKLAARYIKKIKEVQEKGPYYIAGWCFGGVLSYEMTVQLEAMSEEVRFVGLYNSMAMGEWSLSKSFKRKKFTLKTEFDIMQKIFPTFNFPDKYVNITSIEDLWSKVVNDLEDAGVDDKELKKNIFDFARLEYPILNRTIKDEKRSTIGEIIHYYNRLRGAFLNYDLYKPKGKINAQISYIVPTREASGSRDLWNKRSNKEVNFYDIEADHVTMILDDEDVKKLASVLDDIFADLG